MLGTKSLLQLKEIKYLKFYRNKCNSFMGSNPRKKIVSLVCKRLGPNTVLCPSVCVYDVRAEFDFFYPWRLRASCWRRQIQTKQKEVPLFHHTPACKKAAAKIRKGPIHLRANNGNPHRNPLYTAIISSFFLIFTVQLFFFYPLGTKKMKHLKTQNLLDKKKRACEEIMLSFLSW